MNTSPIEYLQDLVSEVPAVNEKLHQRLLDQETEKIPTVVVFAEVGNAIAENLADIPNDLRRKVFNKIEEGMVCSNAAIKTGVATGLIEALVANADKKPTLWPQLEALFGPASAKHAEAWRKFGN